MKKMQIKQNEDGSYDLIVEYDKFDTEFAMDFLSKKSISKNIKNLSEFIGKNAKNIKISSVKFVVSGVILSIIPFASFFANKDEASAVKVGSKISMAYLYEGNEQDYINYIDRTNNSLGTVSPNYFEINVDGSLKLGNLSENFVNRMHEQGIKVTPFLSNHWDRNLGISAINNTENLVDQIANCINKYNLDGINVDIENLTHLQRDAYTNFVKRLRERLPDKEISVAVAANPNNWSTGWHGSYDYEALGKNCDYLVLMAYDEHFQGGDPGPVASIDFVEKSVQYALTKISSEKIVIAMPFFGRIWSETGNEKIQGQGLGLESIEQLTKKHKTKITLGPDGKSIRAEIEVGKDDAVSVVGGNTLTPGRYVIWYENNESLHSKVDLVSKYNLGGVGFWQLGKERPDIWTNYISWLEGGSQSSSLNSTNPSISSNYHSNDASESFGDGLEVGAFNSSTRTGESDVVSGDFQSKDSQILERRNKIYIVQEGDTLFSIAKTFLGSSLKYGEIKSLNNLKSDKITVGQQLILPGYAEASGDFVLFDFEEISGTANYVVKPGDTLYEIAQLFLGSGSRFNEIMALNVLNKDEIYPGQNLKIPPK